MKNYYFLPIAFIITLTLAGCANPAEKTTETTSTSAPVYTDLVYSETNTALNSGPSTYYLNVGPIQIDKYSQIRLNAFFSVGGPNILDISVICVDADGNSLGEIDSFALSPSGSFTATKVYDVPGKYIKISFSSTSSYNVDLAIYGR